MRDQLVRIEQVWVRPPSPPFWCCMDKKVIQEFLKDLQGICFKHKVRFDSKSHTIKLTGKNVVMSDLIAEEEGCQVQFFEDNTPISKRTTKKVATGKFQ